MTLSTEFYDYLHELEKGGSINRFDMDSPELTKLHELASGTFEDRRANCIKLLERGFESGKSLLKQSLQRQLLKFFVEKQEFRLCLTIII